MAIAYTKDVRERARAEDKFIVQISIDGKYLGDESAARLQKKFMGHARFQLTGPMSHEQARSLWQWFRRWQKKRLKEAA